MTAKKPVPPPVDTVKAIVRVYLADGIRLDIHTNCVDAEKFVLAARKGIDRLRSWWPFYSRHIVRTFGGEKFVIPFDKITHLRIEFETDTRRAETSNRTRQ